MCGAGTIVTVEHPEVSGGLTLCYGPDGSAGWDRFGRVTDQTWTNSAGTTTFDDFTYTYDRASNRTAKTNELAAAYSEAYGYDDLNRLTDTDRNGSDYQAWDLDTTGNWDAFTDQGTTETRTSIRRGSAGALGDHGHTPFSFLRIKPIAAPSVVLRVARTSCQCGTRCSTFAGMPPVRLHRNLKSTI
jgi:hypothetical protein